MAMAMPGFTAEVSLYKSDERYRLVANMASATHESTAVYPQACPWYEWISCAVRVAS
jgi:hypothetical protein